MSNSRIMLTCKHCGDQITLGSGYIGSYYCTAKNMEGHLNDFFRKHEHGMCSENPHKSMSDNARDHFVILEEGEKLEDFDEIPDIKHGEWVIAHMCGRGNYACPYHYSKAYSLKKFRDENHIPRDCIEEYRDHESDKEA